MITLRQINSAISEKHPDIQLVRGKGYFYIRGANEEAELKVCALPQSGIYVYSLNQLSLEQWVKEVEHLLTDEFTNNNDYE